MISKEGATFASTTIDGDTGKKLLITCDSCTGKLRHKVNCPTITSKETKHFAYLSKDCYGITVAYSMCLITKELYDTEDHQALDFTEHKDHVIVFVVEKVNCDVCKKELAKYDK